MKLRYMSLIVLIGLILSIPSPSSWAASSTLDDCNNLAKRIDGDFDAFSSNSESLGSCLRERQRLSLVCKSSSHENLAVLVILSTESQEFKFRGFYFPKFEVWINNRREIGTRFSVTGAAAHGLLLYLEIDENQNEQTLLLDKLYLANDIVEDGQEFKVRHGGRLLTIDPDDIFNQDYTEINRLMVDNSLSLENGVGDYFTINRTDGSYVSVRFPGSNGEIVAHQGSCTVAKMDNFSTIWDSLSELTSLYQENFSKELEEMKSSRLF